MIDRYSDLSGQDQKPVGSLERYFSVVNNELPARFRICKKVPVEAELDSDSTENLWSKHSSAIAEFRKVRELVDGGDTNLSKLENPETSLVELKLELARRTLKSCIFCENRCEVNRLQGETGFCGVGGISRIASEFVHRGEEPELVPSYTIFFSGCTLKCQFCQNWDISQIPEQGRRYSSGKISGLIKDRRENGVKNVNWVGGDPTPDLHDVLETLNSCEVNIPSVWNSNMYLTEKGMRLLSGTQDLYLTDFKYGNNKCGLKYSKIPDYWNVVSRNHKLAFEDAEMIIRHLVLPEHIDCCTSRIIKFVKEDLSSEVRVNLMDQYRPVAKARNYPEISRGVSREEMEKVLKMAEKEGLENIVR